MPATAFYKRGLATGGVQGPTKGVWADAPVLAVIEDPSLGLYIHEDWERKIQLATMVTTANENGYYPLLSAGCTAIGNTTTAMTTASARGVRNYMILTTDGTNNLACGLQYAGMTSTPAGIAVMDTGYGRMWYESIVSVSNVTTANLNALIGLRDITASVVTDMANEGADIADIDFVGFAVLHDDGDGPDCIYQTTGSAFATVKSAAATLATSTWFKFGITFSDPYVTYFINGVNVGQVDINTAGFPDGEVLTPYWFIKDDDAVAMTMNVGWWRFLQLYE